MKIRKETIDLILHGGETVLSLLECSCTDAYYIAYSLLAHTDKIIDVKNNVYEYDTRYTLLEGTVDTKCELLREWINGFDNWTLIVNSNDGSFSEYYSLEVVKRL